MIHEAMAFSLSGTLVPLSLTTMFAFSSNDLLGACRCMIVPQSALIILFVVVTLATEQDCDASVIMYIYTHPPPILYSHPAFLYIMSYRPMCPFFSPPSETHDIRECGAGTARAEFSGQS